jgi:hypothetical protein
VDWILRGYKISSPEPSTLAYLASIPPVQKYKRSSEQRDAERFVKMSLKVVFQIQRILDVVPNGTF